MMPQEIQRLPSRDVQVNTTRITQDEAVQANYIPPLESHRRVNDYIQEYDATESKKIHQHEATKKSQEWYDALFRTYQHPLFLALLYFLFQMQYIHTLLYTYLHRWSWFFTPDGQLNTYGIVMKTLLFTAVYTILTMVLAAV